MAVIPWRFPWGGAAIESAKGKKDMAESRPAFKAELKSGTEDKSNTPYASQLARLRKLHESGYIMGYTAQLNPQLLDVSLLVFIEVVLDRTTPEVFDAFKQSVQVIPEVLECHMVAGGFDYLVKARVKDMAAYREFLGKTLLQKGVRETHTYAVMEEVKNTTKLPIK